MNDDLEQRIRQRAHQLWEADGRPEGRELEHWIEAERQVMNEQGLGEPAGEQPDFTPGDRPEPQPELPADPLRNPELIRPETDPEYPATPGPQEMPASRSPQPEIPAESGIAEVPAPAPGAADTARTRSRTPRAGTSGTTTPAETAAPAATAATPGAADTARKRSSARTTATGASQAGGRGLTESASGATKPRGSTRAGRGKTGDAPAPSR